VNMMIAETKSKQSTMTAKSPVLGWMRESKQRSVRIEPVDRGESYFSYIERKVSKPRP